MKKIVLFLSLSFITNFAYAEKEYIRFTFDPYSSGITLPDGSSSVLHKDSDDHSKPFRNYTEALNHLSKEGWEFKAFMPDGSTLLERDKKSDEKDKSTEKKEEPK